MLSDEQWEDLAPAKAGRLKSPSLLKSAWQADGGADAEFQDADPKLLRMIRAASPDCHGQQFPLRLLARAEAKVTGVTAWGHGCSTTAIISEHSLDEMHAGFCP